MQMQLGVIEVGGQRSQVGLDPFPWLHLHEEALTQAEALVQSQRNGVGLFFDLVPGLQHHLLRLLREQRGGLLKLLQVMVTLQQLILVQLRLRMLLQHVQLSDVDLALQGGGAHVHVAVRLVVVQVLALSHEVPSYAPPPQPRRVLPPLHGNLDLAAQGAQRRVDVQILEGATVPTENIIKHGRQIKIPPQEVCFVGFCCQKRRLRGPHCLAILLIGQVLPFAAHGAATLVRAAMLGAVITLNQLALSVGTTAAAVVAVRRHPPAFEDAVHKHVCVLRINLPEAALPRLILLSGDLFEALIERQVVSDRVLLEKKNIDL